MSASMIFARASDIRSSTTKLAASDIRSRLLLDADGCLISVFLGCFWFISLPLVEKPIYDKNGTYKRGGGQSVNLCVSPKP